MPAARVLNVLHMRPDKRGPVELQLLAVADEAARRGVEFVAYFTGPISDWFEVEMAALGARVATLERDRWKADIVAASEREQPDLIHFHFGPHAGITEVSRRGIKVVWTEHSPRPRRSVAPLRVAVRHWNTRKVDLFIAVSEFIAEQTMRDFGISRRRIRVVLNATDLDRFRPRPAEKQQLRRDLLGLSPDHVVITVAAHLRPAKRQALAILAMDELRSQAPEARLVLAGDGPDRAELTELIRTRHLEDVVLTLHGANDVASLYAASDIALLPSTGEGLPGGGIEAIASGIPLVATPNGGTPEVYEDGISGVSVHDQTSHGIATALLALIKDGARRQEMGHRARERAEEVFAISRPARETLDVYSELLPRIAAARSAAASESTAS